MITRENDTALEKILHMTLSSGTSKTFRTARISSHEDYPSTIVSINVLALDAVCFIDQ